MNKTSIRRVDNGFVVTYGTSEIIFEEKDSSEKGLATAMSEALHYITELMEVYNSKHNDWRLNIEVVDSFAEDGKEV